MAYWLPSDLWKIVAQLGGVLVQCKMMLLSRYFRDMIAPMRKRTIRMTELALAHYVPVDSEMLIKIRNTLSERFTTRDGDFIITSGDQYQGCSHDKRYYWRYRYDGRSFGHLIDISEPDGRDIIYVCPRWNYPNRLYFKRQYRYTDDVVVCQNYYVLVVDISRRVAPIIQATEVIEALEYRVGYPQDYIEWYPNRNEVHIKYPL
jgi:hypothetical protein